MSAAEAEADYKKVILLTRFEIARVIGERTEQISRGSPIFVKTRHQCDTAETIAYRELLLKKIPIQIKRKILSNPPHDVIIRISDAQFSDDFIRTTNAKIDELRQQHAERLSMALAKT